MSLNSVDFVSNVFWTQLVDLEPVGLRQVRHDLARELWVTLLVQQAVDVLEVVDAAPACENA